MPIAYSLGLPLGKLAAPFNKARCMRFEIRLSEADDT